MQGSGLADVTLLVCRAACVTSVILVDIEGIYELATCGCKVFWWNTSRGEYVLFHLRAHVLIHLLLHVARKGQLIIDVCNKECSV